MHPVLSISEALAVGKDQFLNSALLEVGETLNLGGNCSTTIGNTLEVVGRSDGGSTAVINKLNATALNLANGSVLSNTYM